MKIATESTEKRVSRGATENAEKKECLATPEAGLRFASTKDAENVPRGAG